MKSLTNPWDITLEANYLMSGTDQLRMCRARVMRSRIKGVLETLRDKQS